MKYAIRGGHTELCTGCSGIINELTENRKVKEAVIKYLKLAGENVLDVTPPVKYTSEVKRDLAYGVDKANSWGADMFISIHFNKAYSHYNGKLGTEVCVYSQHSTAQRIVDKLGALGFKNRGQKIRTELYELKHTKMKAVIVEVCFVEALGDVDLYKKLGADTIGKNIAEAIINKPIIIEKPKQPLYRVIVDGKQVGAYSELSNILNVIKKVSATGFSEIEIIRV